MSALCQVFAKNLLYHRRRLGLTQAELAEAIDTSLSYIGHLERGEREPSLVTIEELSRAFSLWAGELFVTRGPDQETDAAVEELRVLLQDRVLEDVRLVIRLARAAFEDPRLGTTTAPTSPPDRKAERGPKRRSRSRSRR